MSVSNFNAFWVDLLFFVNLGVTEIGFRVENSKSTQIKIVNLHNKHWNLKLKNLFTYKIPSVMSFGDFS